MCRHDGARGAVALQKFMIFNFPSIIGVVYGKFDREPPYFMVKKRLVSYRIDVSLNQFNLLSNE